MHHPGKCHSSFATGSLSTEGKYNAEVDDYEIQHGRHRYAMFVGYLMLFWI